MNKALFFPLLLVLPILVSADQIVVNQDRARFDYQMHCQGCHTGDGSGRKSVPNLKDMGNFLLSQEGREYLIRVPGSANATLSDMRLAEVLNWMLVSYSETSLPESWQPFQADEVGHYRQNPLYEVFQYRKALLNRLDALSEFDVNSVQKRDNYDD